MADASPAPRGDEKPFEDSYWVVPGKLLAGEYPGGMVWQARAKLNRLLDFGITYFVDLTSKADPLRSYAKQLRSLAEARKMSVVYARRSIPDRSCPSKELMGEILDEIDRALAEGHRVYVHCWGGVGRTGTVVGCHLVRSGTKGKEALDRLAELYGTVSRLKRHFNPRSPETEEQRAFIQSWSDDS